MTPAARAVAERALGRPVAAASVTGRAAVAYDPFLAGRVVERVQGTAELRDGRRVPWSAIIKRTEGPGLRAARRELAAYRDGVATPGPSTGLRAPALLAWDERPDQVELWLEEVTDEHDGRWPVARFGIAARHIGAWDADAGRIPLPPGFDAEDAWAERHGQPERLPEALARLDGLRRQPGARDVMERLHDPGFRRIEALIRSTPARISRLATFEQTPLHHDLVRSNLFALGEASTAAIDWENVGRGPLGVDLAPLVIGSVRRGEASIDDLPAIERAVLEGYVGALAAAGIARAAEVRSAYRLALGLRWHVVLGAIGSCLDPCSWGMRGSRRDEPRDEALRHLIGVARHILDAGEALEGR